MSRSDVSSNSTHKFVSKMPVLHTTVEFDVDNVRFGTEWKGKNTVKLDSRIAPWAHRSDAAVSLTLHRLQIPVLVSEPPITLF